MEIIRKRRDMLIARAAQVQASHHQQNPPPPVEPSTSFYPSHQQPITSPPQQHTQLHPQTQQYQYPQMQNNNHNPFANWGHADLFAPSANMFNSNPLPLSISTSHNGSPYNIGTALAPFDDNTNMNSRRTTVDNFDPGLVRFSLDPAKIPPHPEKPAKKSSPEGGKCHGCSATDTAEWRRGPDGPRSLCNACGVSLPIRQHFFLLTIAVTLRQTDAQASKRGRQ
jgi:hypothetical protein